MIKYIIFDFDGTLADSRSAFVSVWNGLADKHNYKKVQPGELESLRKLTINERSKLLNFPFYKIPIVMPELIAMLRDSINEMTLFNGIKDMLSELRKMGYQLAIISSNSVENIKDFLKRNEMEEVITEVLSAKRIFGKDKVIKKFLKAHGLQADEVIYVGDEHRDVVACKKSNVKIIWVGWGYDALEAVQSEGPDYTVYSPEDIIQIVS
ncbi:HAD hydrolase-like protein [Cytobacillus sp. FJAT-54145]|uniref:HAD hydrolase-like protein n=1 Tax=Cytobacillus spartinae TaxID=3299023 RepID=A0ABW6KHC0_9BACI